MRPFVKVSHEYSLTGQNELINPNLVYRVLTERDNPENGNPIVTVECFGGLVYDIEQPNLEQAHRFINRLGGID